MAVQFGNAVDPSGQTRQFSPGDVSLPVGIRPSRTSFDPCSIYVYSTVNADKFNIYLSPTVDQDDWLLEAQVTVSIAAPDGTFGVVYELDNLAERVRVQLDPTASGIGIAYIVPGA